MNWYSTDNRSLHVPLSEIPEVAYAEFHDELAARLARPQYHVAHYFALPAGDRMRFFCLLLDDARSRVLIASHATEYYDDGALPSLTALHPQMHPFERDIAERYGIRFDAMPWPKPLRFPADGYDRRSSIDNYPFYTMEGRSLHEVNVGPIHAGIIEPGAFRFICNGEQILHLEIALGYQHRGAEAEFAATENRLRQACLAETVAGDSAVAHASAFAAAVERLAGFRAPERLETERGIALELERMAMQIADTGALSMDVGYQLGQVACEALRTIVINTTQRWCGNRFAKGLIRFGGTHYPLTDDLKMLVLKNLNEVETRYAEVVHSLEGTSSVLARFEDCGVVTRTQALRIGAVGMAARASGLVRDIRQTHPRGAYGKLIAHDPVAENSGDVYARLRVRMREVAQSAGYVRTLLDTLDCGMRVASLPDYRMALESDALAFSLVEGWRGEVCHVGITGSDGQFRQYKIYDPSLHNWTALALSVRGAGISDFPICNKSFNLSYCGHDL